MAGSRLVTPVVMDATASLEETVEVSASSFGTAGALRATVLHPREAVVRALAAPRQPTLLRMCATEALGEAVAGHEYSSLRVPLGGIV